MQRIDDVENSSLLFHHKVVFADHNELGMRDAILLAIAGADDRRPGSSEMVANQFSIHIHLFAVRGSTVELEHFTVVS